MPIVGPKSFRFKRPLLVAKLYVICRHILQYEKVPVKKDRNSVAKYVMH